MSAFAVVPSTAHLLGFAAALALVHLLADAIPLDDPIPRAYVLSAAGGVSVAYVFVYLLPTLDGRAETIDGLDLVVVTLGREHVYVVAFVGLAAFYGLERLARISRGYDVEAVPRTVVDEPVFWVHVAAFCVYNGFIGYVLVAGEPIGGPAAYTVAMGLHLLGNDEAMRVHHRESYHRYGRWFLAGAVMVGFGTGLFVQVTPASHTVVIALLTGGITFNAIKEELPPERTGSFWAFALGAGGYALFLWLIE